MITFQLNSPTIIYGGEEAPGICYSDQGLRCLSSDEYEEGYEEEMKFAGRFKRAQMVDYKTDSTNGSNVYFLLQILLDRFCITVGGADPGKSCVFPFTTNDGATHTECTTKGNPPDDPNPWCSTLTYENGTHVGGQGKWGHCAPECHGNDM